MEELPFSFPALPATTTFQYSNMLEIKWEGCLQVLFNGKTRIKRIKTRKCQITPKHKSLKVKPG